MIYTKNEYRNDVLTLFIQPRINEQRGILPKQLGFNLRLAYFHTTQLFAGIFADKQLTPIQFAIMETVATTETISQKEIADLVGTTPSVLVVPIRKLEQRGLLTRTRLEEDRRQHQLQLTVAGQVFQNEARILIRQVEAELTADLDLEERATLLNLLQKITGTTI
jgi:DNA-binding MarR family transcriptional regulator